MQNNLNKYFVKTPQAVLELVYKEKAAFVMEEMYTSSSLKGNAFTDVERRNAAQRWADWQCPIHIELVQKFKWSKIIIINDNDDELITHENILKRFSINFMPVAITSIKKSAGSTLDKFNTVLMLTKNDANPNATLEFIQTKLESRFHPTNWVFISQNITLNFKPFFIPHNIKIYLIETEISKKEWNINTLYFATGNILIKKHIGIGNIDSKSLKLKISTHPLPKLMGKQIRITTPPTALECSPDLLIPKDGSKPKGYCGSIIEIIQEFINFTFIVIPTPDGQYGGIYNNNTPYGMLAILDKNEADIGTVMTITSDRAKIADFLPSIANAEGVIVYRQHGVNQRLFFYFEPFSNDVWICIFFITFLTAVLLTVNKYNYESKRRNILPNLIYYLLQCFYTLLLTGVLVIVSNLASNIILEIFHFFSMLMFTSYTSTLTSILAISKEYIPFESLEELVYHTDYAICTLKKSPEEEIIRTAKLPLFSAAWRKVQKNANKYSTKSMKAALQLVYTSKTAYLVSQVTAKFAVEGNCSFRYAKIPFHKTNLAFSNRRKFIYRKMFKTYFLLMMENGVVNLLNSHYMFLSPNEACKMDVNQPLVVPVKLSKIIGLFLTLLAGIAMSFLVFAIEICMQI
uniref:Ionotropic glutamate receptor C-terminal domain-containing protein n=1 Tax=Strigamia maritima TaxID=126957 RepID=T1J6L5_STRMM